jgi:hypothetical protein
MAVRCNGKNIIKGKTKKSLFSLNSTGFLKDKKRSVIPVLVNEAVVSLEAKDVAGLSDEASAVSNTLAVVSVLISALPPEMTLEDSLGKGVDVPKRLAVVDGDVSTALAAAVVESDLIAVEVVEASPATPDVLLSKPKPAEESKVLIPKDEAVAESNFKPGGVLSGKVNSLLLATVVVIAGFIEVDSSKRFASFLLVITDGANILKYNNFIK